MEGQTFKCCGVGREPDGYALDACVDLIEKQLRRQLGPAIVGCERATQVDPTKQGEANPPGAFFAPAAKGTDRGEAECRLRRQEEDAGQCLRAAAQGSKGNRRDQHDAHQPGDRKTKPAHRNCS